MISPIGRALYGERPGHVVVVHAPGGVFLLEIVKVDEADVSAYARDG